MRIALTLLILFCGTKAFNQAVIVPGSSAIQQKWINADLAQMNWYVTNGTNKVLIGQVLTQLSKKDKQLLMITTVKMKQFTTFWTDTSIAELPSLSPVYHSSYNSQRDMVLKFGPVVTGYYNDLMKKENITVSDTTHSPYFDSNLYPAIIRWLPLKEGYSSSMAIYDYNPRGKIGVIKATSLAVYMPTSSSYDIDLY